MFDRLVEWTVFWIGYVMLFDRCPLCLQLRSRRVHTHAGGVFRSSERHRARRGDYPRSPVRHVRCDALVDAGRPRHHGEGPVRRAAAGRGGVLGRRGPGGPNVREVGAVPGNIRNGPHENAERSP